MAPNANLGQTLDLCVIPPLPPLSLPPLPPITDDKLREMVFTHVSSHSIPRHSHTSMMVLDGEAGMDYEKLEHVGDAILESIAVTMVHEIYPNFRQGAAANIRNRLLSNATLAQISIAYEMPKSLVSEPSLARHLKRNEKVQASIFEAYIAGVYYSYLGGVPGSADSTQSSKTASTPQVDHQQQVDCPHDRQDSHTGPPSNSKSIGNAETGSSSDNDDPNEVKTILEKPRDIDSDEEQAVLEDRASKLTLSVEVINDESFASEDSADGSTDDGSIYDEPGCQDEEEDYQQRLEASQDTTSSHTIKPTRTRGEAFDYLFVWLSRLLEPIAAFIVENLKAEERKPDITVRRATREPEIKPLIPLEWAEEDRKALGSKVLLHLHPNIASVGKPVYFDRRLKKYKLDALNPWIVQCVATDCHGKEWKAEAERMTKQAASNVAAWKICVEMGLISEDE